MASRNPQDPIGTGLSPTSKVDDIASGSTRELLRRLELDVTRRLDGLLHGDHRGLVPGHGTELGETRAYEPGDDVRRIDWNVTARLKQPYIRQTIAERELQTWLVVDQSSRMYFGTAASEKQTVALAAAAAVGFLTGRDGNRLGAGLISGDELRVVPARGSRRHLLRILHDIADHPRPHQSGPCDLSLATGRVAMLARRRGLMAVVSDFQVKPGWEHDLSIAAKRHDMLAVQISDPRDFTIPDLGIVALSDPATGQIREINTSRRATREAFASAANDRQRRIEDIFRHARIDHLHLSTDRPWLNDLVSFVVERRLRIRSGARR